ncbi:MAG: 3-hydroxylacyl-ACP dehydratase [Planctomycetes bacterium]|nr:3-hydroxylacyl-ACP dehydratase [Planctomycetota bacterium]
MNSAWPAIAELVPQKPPMVLLDEVVAHADERTSCRVRVRPGIPFADVAGHVPVTVALEYMAQCAAVRSGLRRRAQGNGPVKVGFLIGTRALRFHRRRFDSGSVLAVSVRDVWDDGELASFACEVRDERDGALAAECVLNALIPKNPYDVPGVRPA